jgi:hypothetical protein
MQVSPVSAYLPRTVYQIQKRGAVTLVTMGNRGCGGRLGDAKSADCWRASLPPGNVAMNPGRCGLGWRRRFIPALPSFSLTGFSPRGTLAPEAEFRYS